MSYQIVTKNYTLHKEKMTTQLKMTLVFKGCVRYIFAILFFKSKREHLSNQKKRFLFHFKSSFRSGENQILVF